MKKTFDEIMEKCWTTNGSGRAIYTVRVLDKADVLALYDLADDWEAVGMPWGEDKLSVADQIFYLADVDEPEDTDEDPDGYFNSLEEAVEKLRKEVAENDA